VINASVEKTYTRTDPAEHLRELAGGLDLTGDGVGFLTAVDVTNHVTREDGGVLADATVGLGHPTWAAAPDGDFRELRPGTINLVIWVPVPLSEAALVNTVISATEAKTQALWDHGVDATGTGSDAIFVACATSEGAPIRHEEPHGGPRSRWGARVARAVHEAVSTGADQWLRAGQTWRTSPA